MHIPLERQGGSDSGAVIFFSARLTAMVRNLIMHPCGEGHRSDVILGK